ncbi:MAG TPA: pilus assembly protein HicB [Candidatus Latescibacteria bacterium]|jgi:uncharacterized protein YfaT (DUF1175 family)|nr:pilus assembly protein HicB [Candidatus Latescibacterota bacterium]|tara:strand:+ start:144 stop:389 length:246 start_codon:yes stop_codon:yes gene_type:complete
MSKSSYPLKLPTSVKTAAQQLAREDGVSLNQWIASAVAEKIGAVQTAAEFLKQRTGHARPGDLVSFLDAASDETPSSEDRH